MKKKEKKNKKNQMLKTRKPTEFGGGSKKIKRNLTRIPYPAACGNNP